MTNFNERTNTLLYKNIPLTLYSQKGWWLLCVRGELEMGTDCYIDPKFFWPKQHFFLILAGLLNYGSLRAQSPLSAAGSLFGILSPTDSNSNWNWPKPSVAPGYIIVSRPPASAVPPLIYTGASLDWQLSWGLIYNTSSFHCSAEHFELI